MIIRVYEKTSFTIIHYIPLPSSGKPLLSRHARQEWIYDQRAVREKRQMSVAVRKELLSLRHRFGERTSCKGRLATQFRLVNSGKILSRDERRQMSTPYYCYRAWTAFLHFLIRFTRAIQRNEKGWDALFLYALAVAPLRVFDSLRVFARNEAI